MASHELPFADRSLVDLDARTRTHRISVDVEGCPAEITSEQACGLIASALESAFPFVRDVRINPCSSLTHNGDDPFRSAVKQPSASSSPTTRRTEFPRLDPAIDAVVGCQVPVLRGRGEFDTHSEADRSIDIAEPAAREVARHRATVWSSSAAVPDQASVPGLHHANSAMHAIEDLDHLSNRRVPNVSSRNFQFSSFVWPTRNRSQDRSRRYIVVSERLVITLCMSRLGWAVVPVDPHP